MNKTYDRLIISLVAITLSALTMLAAARQSFQGLGDLPGGNFSSSALGISADGSVVVGGGNSFGEAFRWTSGGGMIGLGLPSGSTFGWATGVSADGSVVVGLNLGFLTNEAFRWTSGGGMVGLGDLEGGTFSSGAFAVSADGSVLVGVSRSDLGSEAFRWTSVGGMVGLGDLDGGSFFSRVWDLSADGSVLVGDGTSASGREAYRWTSGSGMVGLGDLDGGDFFSGAFGVSTDGSVVIGLGNSASGREAFRWTSGGGMVGLGDLAGGSFDSFALGVSGDGSVVVGFSSGASGNEAFIWDETNSMQNLQAVLEGQLGLDLTGWTLNSANAISTDGNAIVGEGLNPEGNTEAWIAKLIDSADCNNNGIPDNSDILDATSADTNTNGIPDECEAILDPGETVVINPTSGTGQPIDEPLVEVLNETGSSGSTVTVEVFDVNLHPDAVGFGVFDTTVVIETSMSDGEFLITLTVPFDDGDLAGDDWQTVELLFFNTLTSSWELAVAGNTQISPGHAGPVGDRILSQDSVDHDLASLSDDVGDYGVFWNSITLTGFAWANVDHTTDFSIGISDSVDSDGDGIDDVDDACPDSDLNPTIVIGGVDTGVDNELQADGCTIADLINDFLADDPSTRGVVHFLVALKAEGIITGRNMGAILKAVYSSPRSP